MKNANLDLKSLPTLIIPALQFVRKYLSIIFFIILAGLVGFLIYQINYYAKLEPSDTEVNDKLQTVQRPHIDQTSIDKIQQLQDQNIDVKTLFGQARDNPFSE